MGRLKIIQEDDSVERVAYLSDVQEVADDLDDVIENVDIDDGLDTESQTLGGAVNEIHGDLETVKTNYLSHLEDTMPHEFRDLKNDKTYKYGFQISEEGNPQLIFKEVENV